MQCHSMIRNTLCKIHNCNMNNTSSPVVVIIPLNIFAYFRCSSCVNEREDKRVFSTLISRGNTLDWNGILSFGVIKYGLIFFGEYSLSGQY